MVLKLISELASSKVHLVVVPVYFLVFFAVVVSLADGFEFQINRLRKSLNPSRSY